MLSTNTTEKFIINSNGLTIGSAAMLLAITWNLDMEDKVKSLLYQKGYKFVVTEVGGNSSSDFQNKVIRAVMGACLNCRLIRKNTIEAHALLHATVEAKRGILVNTNSNTSLALKLAIVRKDSWIAVAMFGQSALHPLTNHERAGLGIMHI